MLDESNSYVEDVLAMVIASFYCFLLDVSILESARYLPGTCFSHFRSRDVAPGKTWQLFGGTTRRRRRVLQCQDQIARLESRELFRVPGFNWWFYALKPIKYLLNRILNLGLYGLSHFPLTTCEKT